MTDHDLIALIQSGKPHKAVRRLYDYLPVVRRSIKKSGGTKQDALDIFQDALVIFCINVSRSDFRLTSSVNSYLFGICKNKWREELRKRGKNETLNWEIKEDAVTQDWMQYENRLQQLQEVLVQVGEKCKRIFTLYYFEKLPMKTIAAKLGYTSEHNATVQKYKCMEQARQLAAGMSGREESL